MLLPLLPAVLPLLTKAGAAGAAGAASGAVGGLLKSGLLSGASNTLAANPLGVALGAGQMIAGSTKNKKTQGMLPAPVSPIDQSTFNMLRRRQQRIATGTEYNPFIAASKESSKTALKNAFAAGGQVNQGMYSNLMSQALRNIIESSSRDTAQVSAQIAEQGARTADISRDIQLLKYTNEKARQADLEKSGFQNLAAAIMPSDKEYQDPFYLKKKLKELEEQQKKAAEEAGTSTGNPQ